MERSIFIALRLVIKVKRASEHQFQISYHTLSVNQVAKNDTQAFLNVEVVSDHCKKLLLCKVGTGAEGNVISLSTYKSLFPNASCNPGGIHTSFTPSSTIITAFGGHALVIMALVFSIWITVYPVNHAHSMLLMLMVQTY